MDHNVKSLDSNIKWVMKNFTLKTINYRFRIRIGINAINYQKIIEMKQHGDNFINFWFKKSNVKIYF